jgi:hypothetical protein
MNSEKIKSIIMFKVFKEVYYGHYSMLRNNP